MKKNISIYLLSILLLTSLLIQTDSFPYSNNTTEIEVLFEHDKFREWITFWESRIPEINGFSIEQIKSTEWRYSNKINLDEWFSEKEFRINTLNYSNEKSFIIDIYSNRNFEFHDNNILVGTGDVDEYFQIVDISDSVLYHFTGGAYVFYDQSIWLTDSICYILGFTFDDSKANEYNETYSKMIIVKWDFNKDSIIIISSSKFPFYKKYMRFSTYMHYLYPNYKM